MDITTAKEYIEKLKEKVRTENSLSKLEKEIKRLDAKLTEEMEENEVTLILVGDLKLHKVIDESFALTGEATGQEWDDEHGEWLKWLRANGNEPMIKIKAAVHASTRKAFLKARRSGGLDIPEFIKVNFWTHVKTNGAEIKRRVENEPRESGVTPA